MPSSYTTSLRFELQFTGENVNLWGDKLNAALQRADDAVAGWLTKPLTGAYTLSTANGGADEARRAMLKFTGTGAFTVTIPAVSKRYDVWNACTGVLTIGNGSASVTLQPGEVVGVVTDGGGSLARVQPTDFGGATLTSVNRVSGLATPTAGADATNKTYVDTAISSAAFSAGAFGVPITGADSGKFLTNNGSAAGWAAVVPPTRAISTAGLATGGGDLTADRTITVPSASSSDILTGTTTAKASTVGAEYSALAEATLADAATIAVDMSTFINAKVTLGGNRALGNPTNPKVGQSGFIRLIQDATGSRTLSFGSNWKRQGGAPTLTTTANATDVLEYQVITSTYILYNVLLNPA